jgi:hypothetical protein
VIDPPLIHLHTDEPFQVEVEEQDEADGVTFRYTVRTQEQNVPSQEENVPSQNDSFT